MDSSRTDDAILITKTCLPMDIRDNNISNLLSNLEQYKKQSDEYHRQVATITQAKVNPTNYSNIFHTFYYLQEQETDHADELLDETARRPGVPPEVLRSISQYYAQSSQYSRLEPVLEKSTVVEPNLLNPGMICHDWKRFSKRMTKQSNICG